MTAPVVISGMHRSATSLLASMFHRAGLHLGDHLLTPSPANRPGYFEDLDFIRFHDELLAHLGTSMYLESAPRGDLRPDQRTRAEALVAARRHRPAWGWKDPRTCLFLETWRSIVPAARFVFVFRRPAEVADSLRRRGDAQLHLQYPGAATLARLGVPRFRIGRALHMWLRYNACIADFAERHPERCHVVRADDLASAGPRLVAALAATGVPLRAAEADGAIQAGLLTRRAAPAIERRCRRSPAVAALLGRLEALADRPPDHA